MATQKYQLKSGKVIPGVTTIISQNLGWNKEALIHWGWKEGWEGRNYRDTRREAADAGSIAHHLIDCYVKKRRTDIYERYPGAKPKEIAKAKAAYMNFLVWANSFKVKFLKNEIPVKSQKHQYGGTLDCIAMVGGSLCVVDWKTGERVYADMQIQLAAYGKAWEEMYPTKRLLGGYHLLQFERDTAAFHHHHWTDLEDAWQVFLILLRLNKFKKKLKG